MTDAPTTLTLTFETGPVTIKLRPDLAPVRRWLTELAGASSARPALLLLPGLLLVGLTLLAGQYSRHGVG